MGTRLLKAAKAKKGDDYQYFCGSGGAGRRGLRPAAGAYEDCVKNVPLIRDDPIRASEPGNRCALHPVYVLMLDLVRKTATAARISWARSSASTRPPCAGTFR